MADKICRGIALKTIWSPAAKTPILKRNTLAPRQDFVVLQWTRETVDWNLQGSDGGRVETRHHSRPNRTQRRNGNGCA
jgi:hypothetical protein